MMHFILFPGIIISLLACQPEKSADHAAVAFNDPWSSPFRVSDTYCHQLVNREGKYLYILNKTAWAYFGCEYPEKVIENTKAHGANVIRVCLEGTPYLDALGYDLWPWKGNRQNPDYNNFNTEYWDEVERRIRLAGGKGIGIDLVLYFSLVPSEKDIEIQKKYWKFAIDRLSKYSNILVWEIMNEEISNEVFQDSAGNYLKSNDPFQHPVISSAGTTDDALWPHKNWMDMAIVHTCTGNQDNYDLKYWYLNIAQNIRQYGKPAFNNESGREVRHKNNDPVHRRKQAWLFSNSGCFWTWHSWDGCEGINDTLYRAPGWEYLEPVKEYYESLPFWLLEINNTIFYSNDDDLIFTSMSSPDRSLNLTYCCTRKTGQTMKNVKAYIRIKNGLYRLRFIDPPNLKSVSQMEFRSEGLRDVLEVIVPEFRDDLLLELTAIKKETSTLIEGTL